MKKLKIALVDFIILFFFAIGVYVVSNLDEFGLGDKTIGSGAIEISNEAFGNSFADSLNETIGSGLAGSPNQICEQATPAEGTGIDSQYAIPPENNLADVDYQAVLCTSQGSILVDLYEDLTPVAVNNFIFLADEGFYNNTTFHRVITNFLAQGGDPTGTGLGGPGYIFRNEIVPELTFDRAGLLAMANPQPNANGSQFFITFTSAEHLNGDHTIFGHVLWGQGNVIRLTRINPSNPDPSITPSDLYTVVIVTAEQVSQ
ncbi:MAG: hypothetical protein Phog2KO_28030 [Phototrophicaceae bacterium]